ncbi:indolepyruvate oxidoreductase subunit B [Bradyrhizobium japonicum]|uniref:Indolepyruvate oxidoreductase subunit B n=1 Tax=Bradyrhizobium japonicum TaxID=375 RepID=A0A0A3XVD9_BRAJP|nr:indolepyruvate oxidoreductase subunit beta family protein [Bradyrhizobium japonicum]KGT78432.1 indolepyruvate oxidoreductase subunit B [Bradyrhizobium japonicum]MCS3897466.1 indolepyruvate ferredoxin oxidoreductase beta subunit [Bradyrhizobium japonicum USDA 38]MCS3949980.1 indolepyruvate ferredoxin oxidoreductase beta subunit [Bradyrhizobium japonicum]MCW2217426.1 indolepyruvate ferredoxin oxidoreductase beta subunit [Bradyrhizobium japonicum]MCW2342040.1 indolepyruvate ferredoxin oxidored
MRDETVRLALPAAGEATERPISIAIVAMGGQGGGVLTDWIVQLAENHGWVAQSTSVPGVAQRTGATIYYIEAMPPLDGRKPILSLMPTPGDVDVVMAAEFMEAGRSILRGLVTPDRTTLIASNHRSFAIGEKIAPGNGIADGGAVTGAIGVAAKSEIIFDLNALAIAHGSVISAAMFGALAAAAVLPFSRDSYLDVIRAGGKGAKASVETFEAAFDRVKTGSPEVAAPAPSKQAGHVPFPATPDPDLAGLIARLKQELPEPALTMARAGLRKVVDFQDVAYGAEYLDILKTLHTADRNAGGGTRAYAFTEAAAKYLANAMTYDDVIRVADLKTRAGRRARIESELEMSQGQVLQTTEFMHPRMEEVMGVLPVGFARWLGARPRLLGWLDRRVNRGRRVRTYSLPWFLTLYVVAGLRGLRRRSLRHAIETAHRDGWLKAATDAVATNYQLGVEILQCRRLVKGYSDTHSRGLSKFDRTLAAIKLVERREDAADWARRLREAALKDSAGKELDGVIQTIKTFA